MSLCAAIGSDRSRLPVAAKMALQIAGATGGTAGLANATGPRIAWDDVDVEHGHLIQPQHAVVVEITLLHLTALGA